MCVCGCVNDGCMCWHAYFSFTLTVFFLCPCLCCCRHTDVSESLFLWQCVWAPWSSRWMIVTFNLRVPVASPHPPHRRDHWFPCSVLAVLCNPLKSPLWLCMAVILSYLQPLILKHFICPWMLEAYCHYNYGKPGKAFYFVIVFSGKTENRLTQLLSKRLKIWDRLKHLPRHWRVLKLLSRHWNWIGVTYPLKNIFWIYVKIQRLTLCWYSYIKR